MTIMGQSVIIILGRYKITFVWVWKNDKLNKIKRFELESN